MAEVDAAIPLGIKPVQLDNPQDIQAKGLQLSNLGLQNQTAQQDYQDNQTLRSLYAKNIGADGTLNQSGLLKDAYGAGLGTRAVQIQQQMLANQQTQSVIGKNNADTKQAQSVTADNQFGLQEKKLADIGNRLYSLISKPDLTRQDVIDQANQLVDAHSLDPATRDQMLERIPTDPKQLKDFLVRAGMQNMTLQQQIAAQTSAAPQLEKIDNGPSINLAQRDPLTGQVTMGQSVAKGVSPDTSANITKDYAVARMNSGLDANGNLAPAGEATAQGLANGSIPYSARLEGNQRGEAIIARAMQINPKLDIPTLQARSKAIDQYTNGLPAQMMQANGTAQKHLALLGGMIDQMDNTSSPAFNAVANVWKTQTGQSAPNNLDLAKTVAADEVMKSLVPGSGGEAERMALADKINKAGSPKQLKDAVATALGLMKSQNESYIQRGRAAGVPDSVFVDYTEGGANGRSPNAPSVPVVPVKSDADYASLPSGTPFIAPDGSHRVKP